MTNPRIIRKIPITWDNDGYSQPIPVSPFRDVGVTVVGTGDVQVLATKEWKEQPLGESVDFKAPSTIDNSFGPIVVADEGTPNTYVTTITTSSTTFIGEVNTNLLTFICLTRSADTVDAFVSVCDNS